MTLPEPIARTLRQHRVSRRSRWRHGSEVALIGAAVLSAIALFGLEAGITRLTGTNPVRSGTRQLAFGATAAAITYGIGLLVGSALR